MEELEEVEVVIGPIEVSQCLIHDCCFWLVWSLSSGERLESGVSQL